MTNKVLQEQLREWPDDYEIMLLVGYQFAALATVDAPDEQEDEAKSQLWLEGTGE